MRYNNYHKHTHYSNLRTIDVVTKPHQYIKRAKELNHNTYFTTEHGWGGNVFEAYTLCQKEGLKCIYAVEAYYVDNRFDSDRGNFHIILVAKNNSGFKQINKIVSLANTEGYYYKPRIDLELLLSLNPNDVIITTACVASRLFKGDDWETKFLIPLHNHFKDNLFLEVQNHNEDIQKIHNKKIIDVSNKYGIKIIHGNDSHYISEEESKYRDLFLKGKGIQYHDESNFILDYPTANEIMIRYSIQGVLSQEQAEESIKNTLVFDECEDLGFTKDFKIPKITQGDSNKVLRDIISKEFKKKLPTIDIARIPEYKMAIMDEVNTIGECGMADYFILDYTIVKRAVEEYDAVLTRSGRGSAVSFLTNKILGLTEVDRLKAPVTLYPSRFMTAERILNSKSLPDIDLNFANVEPVIKASKDVLGQDGIYYMIAYKPLQESSAFRLWCKANNFHVSEYNDIAKNLDDYIEDEYWGKIIEESKVFRGVIESVAPSPCSFLLLDKPISEEVGLIKVKDQICCCLDGYQCDQWKFLKNDYLTVKVYKVISEVYKEIGQDIDTIEQLMSKVDESVWKLYEDGITATLNQADSDFARNLVMKYCPKSLGELSAWVAAIRPGFASLLNQFLNRENHTTGVKELDELLKDSYSYCLYQESIMKFLVWLDMPEKDTYDIIKKISKKKFTEEEIETLKARLKKSWINKLGREEGFDENWKVIEDAVRYSFNASHSLSVAIDSVYGAYLKRKHSLEYMTVALNNYSDDTEETSKICNELSYFNIKLKSPKFRYSKGDYMYDKDTNSIYKGIESIKFLNKQCADELYSLKERHFTDFVDLLDTITKEVHINSKQMKILILLDFFEEFGKSQKLIKTYAIYSELASKKQIKKDNLINLGLDIKLIRKYSIKETEKIFKDIDMLQLLKEQSNTYVNKSVDIKQKIRAELEFLGYVNTTIPTLPTDLYYVLEVEEFKNKKSITYYPKLYNIKTGETIKYKLKNFLWFSENPFDKNNVINITKLVKEGKRKLVDGKWTISKEEFWNIIESWEVY